MIVTTVIRNADWVVAWDAEKESHIYLRNADVAFTGNIITFVGKSYQGQGDQQVDGRGLMAMPGLVNIHAHPGEDAFIKGLNDYPFDAGEEGERAFLKFLKSPRLRRAGEMDLRPLAAEVGYAELLRSGVTTLVDISESSSFPGWVELLERSGLRAYLAPAFPSFTSEEDVEQQLAEALAVIDRAMASRIGRLSGAVLPFDLVSVPADLLRASFAEARARGIPWMIHAAEAILEVNEVKKKHGVTPVRLLDQLGLLGPHTILAHAIYFDHHPALKSKGPHTDLRRVAESGASVAHAPYGFALCCVAMDSFSRYRQAGINVGLGTDTFGHNMLEEMRLTMAISRVVSGRVQGSTTADVFRAATVGGARALGRNDIGYLARDAMADIVLVDLNHPAMQPIHDPLRSLVLQAGDRAVRDVYIDGRKIVENGRVLTLDLVRSSHELDEAMRRTREVAAAVEDGLGAPGGGSMFAVPLRLSLTRCVNQVIEGREVLHGRVEDVPFGHCTPERPGFASRALLPYGISPTVDVAVVKHSPEVEIRHSSTGVVQVEGKWIEMTDWYMQTLSGTGAVEIEGKWRDITPGTVVLIPAGTSGVVANRGDSDLVHLSIHPHLDYEYKMQFEDGALAQECMAKVKAMTPGKIIYTSIKNVSFREVPGGQGLAAHQLVLSRDFDVSLRRLRGGTPPRESDALAYDLYVHGVAGSGLIEVNGRKMEVAPDWFVFLPQGATYALSNPNDSDWEFIWLHAPAEQRTHAAPTALSGL
jgi:cytosine/adenosine deaminase-related metal-dependent hydrolase/mannose-6-phosphate isomerase-like protein (cupin superfamily)